jgi:hypothetical protein
LVIVFDRLVAPGEFTYEYWLHAVNQMTVRDQHHIEIRAEDVACSIDIMTPPGLVITQTDQYDPNPWPQITTREWHLTATTPSTSNRIEFVTLFRPHRVGAKLPGGAELTRIDGGYLLEAELPDGNVRALLPAVDGATLDAAGLTSQGSILVQRHRSDGSRGATISVAP